MRGIIKKFDKSDPNVEIEWDELPPPDQLPMESHDLMITYYSVSNITTQAPGIKHDVTWSCYGNNGVLFGTSPTMQVRLYRRTTTYTKIYIHEQAQWKSDQIVETRDVPYGYVMYDVAQGQSRFVEGLFSQPTGLEACTLAVERLIVTLLARNVKSENVARGLKDSGINSVNGVNIFDYKFYLRDLGGLGVKLHNEQLTANQFINDLQHFANVEPKLFKLSNLV
jgi:hypothetical protein